MCNSQAERSRNDSTGLLAVRAAQKDLEATRREYYFELPPLLAARLQPGLQDQRDAAILLLFWNVSVTALPASIAVFLLPAWSHLLGPAYLLCSYVLFLERYLLALHYSEHRKLFKTGQLDLLRYQCGF